MDKVFIETVYFGIVISLLTYWVATKIRKKFPYPIFNPLLISAIITITILIIFDIDFETYTLEANDRLYQQNVNNLENTQSFATMFLVVVIVAGCAILCLVLILTIRNRYYEIGVFLSLGQNKIKIILQQLLEILMIATVAFALSLTTGKAVSNVVGNILESSVSDNGVRMEMPPDGQNQEEQTNAPQRPTFNDAFVAPENEELDVSLTTQTVLQLAGITVAICLVSITIPSVYVLRLTPREILTKREG